MSVEVDFSVYSEKRRVSGTIEREKTTTQKGEIDNTRQKIGAQGSIPLHAAGYCPACSHDWHSMDSTRGTS
jgi:hypothetical protein